MEDEWWKVSHYQPAGYERVEETTRVKPRCDDGFLGLEKFGVEGRT